jgi:PAS domain S-box-containing protein
VLAALFAAYYADVIFMPSVRVGPFSAFYGVVILASWCGGLRLGLLATVASAVIVATQFMPGLDHPVIIEPHALIVMFVIVASVLSAVLAYAQVKRKRAEESGSLARAVVDSTSDGVFVKDVRGKYLMINQAGAAYVTKSVQDIVGEDDSHLFPHPADVRRIRSNDRQIMVGGEARTLDESVVIDGRERFFVTTKAPYRGRHGEVIGVVGITHDVTEQKKDERANKFLGEATAHLGSSLEYGATMAAVVRAAVPTLGDGCAVHILDEDTGALRMLAVYHPDPAKVAAAWELERKYPSSLAGPWGAAVAIRTGQADLIAEIDEDHLAAWGQSDEWLRIVRSFGTRSFLCVPMLARSRTLGAMSFAMVDSGRRYRLEDVPLATEIARRAAIAIDHARMYELSRQAVSVREDFLSIASHELRTPLTALQIGVQRLLRQVGSDGGLGASSASMLATVDRSTRRLTQLVDDLLDISRLMSQRTTYTYEDIDARDLVGQVLTEFRDTLSKAGCSVTLTTDGNDVGQWNHERLHLALTNLVSNAAKYGSGKPIEITVVGDATTVRISVTDHGIGIAREAQARIFERFERAVSERHYGGFGLGLWIVKQIVSNLHGKVEVASEVGKGSTFTVTLPKQPPQTEAEISSEISA